MTNKTYDILKWINMIVMPALMTFVATIFSIWGLDNSQQIVATLAALNTMLGALLKVSSTKYLKGDNDNGKKKEK